jgi:hypothetical protein
MDTWVLLLLLLVCSFLEVVGERPNEAEREWLMLRKKKGQGISISKSG